MRCAGWKCLLANILCVAYYIAFGAHGPRAQTPPGEGLRVAGYTALGVLISFGIFSLIRAFAKGKPSTMHREYEEATNEYLKVSPHYRTRMQMLMSVVSKCRADFRTFI